MQLADFVNKYQKLFDENCSVDLFLISAKISLKQVINELLTLLSFRPL